MEEEIKLPEIIPVPEIPAQLPKKNSLKVVLLVVLGLLVAGGLVYAGTKIGKRQITPSKIITAPTLKPASPTPDPTANWKTYTDDVAKFEIKYPANWLYTIKSKTTTFFSPDQPNVPRYSGTVSFISTEGQIDIVFGGGFGGGPCAEMKSGGKLVDANIGSYTVPLCQSYENQRVNYSCGMGDTGGVETPNASYCFIFSYPDSMPQSKNLIDQILSTFKFTD